MHLRLLPDCSYKSLWFDLQTPVPTKTALRKHTQVANEKKNRQAMKERNKNHLSNSGVNVEALEAEAFEIEFHIAHSLHEGLIVIEARRATAAREERHGSGRQVPDGGVDERVGRRRRIMAHEKQLEELRGLGVLDKQRDAHLPRDSDWDSHRAGQIR